MEGWIKIHRSILHNWIFSDEEKFRAWIIILLTVNYETKKVNIGNLLLTCHRGESLLSLDSWAKLFGKGWNKSKVRRFFDLLKNDSMIVLKSEQKTTRLTVCKYDTYQDPRNDNETQVKRKRNASETQTTPTKEGKESKEEITPSFINLKNNIEERELQFKKEVETFQNIYSIEMLKSFFIYWSEANKSKSKMRYEMEKTWDTKRRLINWFERNKKK